MTSLLSFISVPRPAIFVAIVTAPGCPARETISASDLCCLALRTLWGIFFLLSILDNSSETSTVTVPTSTG